MNEEELNEFEEEDDNTYIEEWHHKTGWIVFILIIFFPVGLWFVWKHPGWETKTKQITTGIFCFVLVFSILTNSEEEADGGLAAYPVDSSPSNVIENSTDKEEPQEPEEIVYSEEAKHYVAQLYPLFLAAQTEIAEKTESGGSSWNYGAYSNELDAIISELNLPELNSSESFTVGALPTKIKLYILESGSAIAGLTQWDEAEAVFEELEGMFFDILGDYQWEEEPVPTEGEEPSETVVTESTTEEDIESEEIILPINTFVGSSDSDKYHYDTCRWVKEILEANLITFETIEVAQAKGYFACGTCEPK